jgi:mono/diheme cytochrome c family protein
MHRPYITKAAVLSLSLMIGLGLTACQKAAEAGDKAQVPEAGQETVTEEFESTEFDAAYIDVGREIAATHCVVCHAVGATGDSPRADAPPLRTVLANYNPDALATDFREHIHVGHPDMPDFDFTVLETEGLLAYLTSIQEAPE